MSAVAREFLVHVDGASSGNPGPAAAGVVIAADDGTVVHEEGYYLGRTTNNVAEYYALLIALEELLALRAESAVVYTDSELMVMQLTGRYKVKAPGLKFVHARVKRLSSLLKRFEIQHVPREDNMTADKLARDAVKEATRKTERR
ncbi:MAG TPA: ribonuclease HI family protein [Planctomycetota bacterium]|nr:ribonuclease HI family protein [Planctomycetota bacterium]